MNFGGLRWTAGPAFSLLQQAATVLSIAPLRQVVPAHNASSPAWMFSLCLLSAAAAGVAESLPQLAGWYWHLRAAGTGLYACLVLSAGNEILASAGARRRGVGSTPQHLAVAAASALLLAASLGFSAAQVSD